MSKDIAPERLQGLSRFPDMATQETWTAQRDKTTYYHQLQHVLTKAVRESFEVEQKLPARMVELLQQLEDQQ